MTKPLDDQTDFVGRLLAITVDALTAMLPKGFEATLILTHKDHPDEAMAYLSTRRASDIRRALEKMENDDRVTVAKGSAANGFVA